MHVFCAMLTAIAVSMLFTLPAAAETQYKPVTSAGITSNPTEWFASTSPYRSNYIRREAL